MTRISPVLIAVLLGGCTNGEPPGEGVERAAVGTDGNVTQRETFGAEPAQWEFPEGTWVRREADGNDVLAQTSTDRVFPVAIWKRQRFGDVDVTIRFKPISGRIDSSGGIIFRARDGKNYYVVRANSLEDNFRLYTVTDGDRDQIASTRVDPPALGEWHTLRVVAVGPRIQAYLNGRLLIDHRDETFQMGYVGLWTKADAVTEFDDLEVKGVPAE
ncbi:MAG: family 16 glycoside hydrolase [Planctomycetaceae bacterium]